MKITIPELKEMCISILINKGFTEDQAEPIFSEYLDGQLRGRECHGFADFARNVQKLTIPTEEVEVLKNNNNLIYLDAKENIGQLVCNKYVPQLIKKAKEGSIAMMGIKNMRTYLMPGTYVRMIAENDLMGFIFNYGGAPRIAPTGSNEGALGVNPIAIGIPGKDFPIVSDYAPSVTAMGKVRLAEKLGKEVKPGVGLDKEGNATISPEEIVTLLPFAGHKGYALALTGEILGRTIFGLEEKGKRGFFFLAFNPGAFEDINKFKDNVSKLIEEIKSKRKEEGVEEIFVPGERSERLKNENLKKEFIEIDDKIIEEIKALQ
jgi:LDH2 family malate/lactate/ureidoglycolate dehydrogenase